MRTDLSLKNVLHLYRNTAFVVGGLAVVLFGLALAGFEAHWQQRVYLPGLLLGAALVSLGQIALFRFGYKKLKRALVIADRQRRAAIATANRDALTGAFNRRHFRDELSEMVRNADKQPVGYIEITETVPLRHDSVERRNVETLRAAGVRIAVDDFGAGHASLGYLRMLDFDILKIDRSYVSALTTNRTDAMIVDAITGIARARGMSIIAEGVETKGQRMALEKIGCTGLQGYLLGRPVPLAGFIAAHGLQMEAQRPSLDDDRKVA